MPKIKAWGGLVPMAELRTRSTGLVRVHSYLEIAWEVGGTLLAIALIADHSGKWFAQPATFFALLALAILATAFPLRYKHSETVLSVDLAGGPMIAALLLLPRSEAVLIVLVGELFGAIRLGRKFFYYLQNVADMAASYGLAALLLAPSNHVFTTSSIGSAFVISAAVYCIASVVLQSWLCINQGFSFVEGMRHWTASLAIDHFIEFFVSIVIAALISRSMFAFGAFVVLSAATLFVLRRSAVAENDRDKLHVLFDFATRSIDKSLTAETLANDVLKAARQTLPYETISLQQTTPDSELASVYLWEVDGVPTWLVGERSFTRGDNAAQIFEWFTVLAESSKRIRENLFLQEQLRNAALHDGLTGLANRRLFDELLHRVAAQAQREGTKIGLLFIDLDKFKDVNDTYGHEAGDQVLKTMAARFHSVLRDEDVVARLGGDEFVVMLPSIGSRDNVEDIARRIFSQSTDACYINGDAVFIGASVGMAMFPDHAELADQLVRIADRAMYEAKQSRAGLKWADSSARNAVV